MPYTPISVRSFSNSNAAQRVVYHTSEWKAGGTLVPPSTRLGTIQMLICPNSLTGTPNGKYVILTSRKVYGSFLGLYEMKVPTFNALAQLYGGTAPTSSTILIRLLAEVSLASRGLTFTETTAINAAV
jgi:hypothetical protein